MASLPWATIVSVVTIGGTLITILATWGRDLNSAARRIRILDEATKRIAFWSVWSQALATADPQADAAPRIAKIESECEAAAAAVNEAYCALAVEQATEAKAIKRHEDEKHAIPRWRERLVLYKPPRGRAWYPRVFFYTYAVSVVCAVGYDIAVLMQLAKPVPAFGWIGVVTCLVLAIFFRWWSLWLEKPPSTVQAT